MTRRVFAAAGGMLALVSCGYHVGGKADLVPKGIETIAIFGDEIGREDSTAKQIQLRELKNSFPEIITLAILCKSSNVIAKIN